MNIFRFPKRSASALCPDALRAALIDAASGPPQRLQAACERYKDQVAKNVDVLQNIPPDLDPADVDDYLQRISAVAHCLHTQCDAPQLWERLTSAGEENVLQRWEQWLHSVSERMDALEYDALIREAHDNIKLVRVHAGQAARAYEAAFLATLGSLLFHSGDAAETVEPLEAALALCREERLVEAELEYLLILMEAQRYLGQWERAVRTAQAAVDLHRQLGREVAPLVDQIRRLREGEPACRVVLVLGDQHWELEAYDDLPAGPYQLEFRTNRPTMHRCTALVHQGVALAADERIAEALEKYREAAVVDPHDPRPRYQLGVCYMETQEYTLSRECFEEVERISPGWLWCRTELWLARGLEAGTVSRDALRRHRILEDPELDPVQARELAQDAVAQWPDFAPFYLTLGELRHELDEATATLRAGLERVSDPDLESRLLGALIAVLPRDSSERDAMLDRILALDGSLLARAAAGFNKSSRRAGGAG